MTSALVAVFDAGFSSLTSAYPVLLRASVRRPLTAVGIAGIATENIVEVGALVDARLDALMADVPESVRRSI